MCAIKWEMTSVRSDEELGGMEYMMTQMIAGKARCRERSGRFTGIMRRSDLPE